VTVACGLCLLSEEEKRENGSTGFMVCLEQEKRKENFTLWTFER
jgi:hypothetical protein